MERNKTQRRYSDLERQELIEQWKQSGQNKLQFCKDKGIGYHTLLGWLSVGQRKIKLKASPSFIPVAIKQSSAQIFAQVTLKNGAIVSLHQRVDVSYLVSLVKS